jgi:hypothetical protein
MCSVRISIGTPLSRLAFSVGFFEVPAGECWDSILIRPRSLHSKSFLIPHTIQSRREVTGELDVWALYPGESVSTWFPEVVKEETSTLDRDSNPDSPVIQLCEPHQATS